MIVYFADRKMNIVGQASTELPKGLVIVDDLKTEDVETGVAVFECTIPYTEETRSMVKNCTKVGNYILRSNGEENEFYTIIDCEKDTKKQEVNVYAEDAGLDLLNEVVGAYAADKAYPISYYIEKFSSDSGFVIGINEIPNLTRKLSWDGETTATERIASVATQFDGCEISYSFSIKGLSITNKYINIFKKRGQDIGAQLRLNKEVDSIVTSESIANLATALLCTGGTPEGSETPVTLNGYPYDDGNYYVSGSYLMSREALKKWSRYVWPGEPNKTGASGHIVKTYTYDTTSQSELCNRALTELKKISEIEVNYEAEIHDFPENIRLGDRVNIIDDGDELYLSTRLLKLETSVVNRSKKATLGEYLLKKSGIHQKVMDLAEKFAQNSQSAERALQLANSAQKSAEEAQKKADAAVEESVEAKSAADEAKKVADSATQSSAAAQEAANAAKDAVSAVEKEVESIETTVSNAQQAADNAYKAAETAGSKAEEAKQAAANAVEDAEEAKTAAGTAQSVADSAVTKAETAIGTADTAKAQAESASATAAAAKEDAKKAQEEIDNLGNGLETLENTMKVDYARKTDLTETEANLQTQIKQNAAGISSTASKVQEIDETANSAAADAAAAKKTAAEAQAQADAASTDATTAQQAADTAKTAAEAAQAQADTAKNAAQTAESVANKAEQDLAAAKADLETVTSRVDATEEDIAAAEGKVAEAQAAADKAKADAAAAQSTASSAQSKADMAVENADAAQQAANDAATKAALAQKTADVAKGDAAAAQAAATEAASAASAAQNTANTAKENATAAQATADKAVTDAKAAADAAAAAGEKANTAAADLEAAKKNLEEVSSKVDATEEEVAAAQAAVDKAQAAADAAKTDAVKAQNTADTAKENATAAQQAADTAKAAADAAQTAADEAKKAADKAQADADALEIRVTKAETKITQNSEKIELAATKEEVVETLGGYYTKTETDAAIKVQSDAITSSVKKEYATKQEVHEVNEEVDNAQSTADTASELANSNEARVSVSESEIKQLSDAISQLVTDENGSSLMTQTSNGWTFNIGAINKTISDATNKLNDLSGTVDEANGLINGMKNTIDGLSKKTAYIVMTTDDTGAPCIELGKEGNNFRLRITNTSVDFMDGTSKIAYVSNQALFIEKAIIKNELQIGEGVGFVWKRRVNGNLGLRWVGGR